MFGGGMVPDLRPNHCSIFWRAIYVGCMCLVFSYVLFDLLDLDGSDFPLKQHPLERTLIVGDLAKDPERAYSLARLELWPDRLMLSQATPDEAVYVRFARALTFSTRDSARIRGYRVALPRSSPWDPFILL
jgi:hypothetical protein